MDLYEQVAEKRQDIWTKIDEFLYLWDVTLGIIDISRSWMELAHNKARLVIYSSFCTGMKAPETNEAFIYKKHQMNVLETT